MKPAQKMIEDYELASVEEIIADVKAGIPVILVDDESRENEGDLIVAAEMATPEVINFMAKDGRGLICLPMESAMIDRLGLEMMGRGDNTHHRTAFTVSIEAKEGVTTGISAADRAHTIAVAIDPKTSPDDIATPGHVFPLRAKDGGVLVRAGHTEAAVDLAKMAGFSGAGVICEVMNDDGSMARLPDLIAFAQRHGLKVGTIADLISYRARNDTLIERLYTDTFTSVYGGSFTRHLYANTLHYAEHIALVKGDIVKASGPVLVRMHAVDIFADILGEDDHDTVRRSMQAIDKEGCGVIVLLREPHADSLSKRLRKDEDNAEGDATFRRYGIGAQILRDLGVSDMVLLTDKPKALPGLDGYGLSVSGFQALSKES